MPSLDPDQAYEVRVRIAEHPNDEFPREVPVSVEWAAGDKFQVKSCEPGESARFAAVLSYWAPMLVQARITFRDGAVELGTIYAEKPIVGAQQAELSR